MDGENIKKLKKKFRGFWLGIKVTKRGKYKEPILGKIIAKAKTHHGLHCVLKDPDVYETFAGKTPTQAVLF
ncbi:hypothetical protein A3J90_01885 [candidate division WOR-1 bacterium RIFOXYC2_FULL_37_10]|uniref:Uncharacterized protein n=1 Tax=candidate division WOR-1 bacterium RIFOXYB2_FULL_37_13 TaxID=1802579 RepID=A0A1F4SU93_UNCSA|nr:MAG: hypothetical protein A2310_05680 [candidate division WOR-1 bacterium RIFOXYB2_FULL_37_13]OGC33909.1 MAG: hypothetical protein A3J90_01885 [candidate division WOR-1 bacterium RIFOXYC2_FULL_37_10]